MCSRPSRSSGAAREVRRSDSSAAPLPCYDVGGILRGGGLGGRVRCKGLRRGLVRGHAAHATIFRAPRRRLRVRQRRAGRASARVETVKCRHHLHARDLTDAAWQSDVTDERIFNSISNGKGKMPSFKKKLTTEQIESLVAYVRGLKR